jgi:hypothetical protein
MLSRFESFRARTTAALALTGILCWCSIASGDEPPPSRGEPPANNYPTYARVQYVQECMSRAGGSLAQLYQCSCAIDHIAQHLTYDDFVEATTFAHYATLPGEGGGIFRDTEHAKQQAKLYHRLEADAYQACGMKPPPS